MTMKSVDLPHLRSVVLAGHAGGGKTTLAEQLLFKAGAIPRLGKVDDGSAHLDFEPEEQKRRQSLSLAVGTFEYDGTRISLVDTPGYGDFVADARAGLRVADAAILVVDAVAGVQVQTEKVWKMANDYGLPRIIVINRMDRERADFFRALDSLKEAFGPHVVATEIPIGAEHEIRGLIDLVDMKAYLYDGSGKDNCKECPIPEDMQALARRHNERCLSSWSGPLNHRTQSPT